MSLVPAFEIGVWNAWILTIFVFLYIFLSQVFKGVGEKIAHVEEEKKLGNLVALVSVIILIYSIFLPLKLGTPWFYTGLAIYLIGLIILTITVANIAATPPGEPFTIGMYRYSRHPLSLGMLFTFIGIGIASTSWLCLLLSAIILVITHFMLTIEERACLEKFGDAYGKYVKRTPRWLGIPKPAEK
jgi:protein-S-isoprenylcysteine O-methyltransferase Ste14